MDRLQQIRAEEGGSQDSTVDGSSTNDAFLTANDSSKFYSITGDSSFDISIREVDVTPASLPETTVNETENVVPELSPIVKISSALDGYKIGKQIEAANILSGGVNIFDDNENSYGENDLVIDDNVGIDSEVKPCDQKVVEAGGDLLTDVNLLEAETAVESKDTEVVLQIDGKNVDAIDIGNGLYLYRKEGQTELAVVQIIDDDQQPNFKFLKVRENAEGNLEVYEEIEIEVPKEMPEDVESPQEKTTGHVPIKDISKVICEPASNKATTEQIKPAIPEPVVPSNSKKLDSESQKETDPKLNLNMKMKMSEARKSPLSFTPISYHSTPNKDGVPLTKTMVDLHLQPSRHSDNVKKTIEVHTDVSKQRPIEPLIKLDENKESASTEKEQSNVQLETAAPSTKLEVEKKNEFLDKTKTNNKQGLKLCDEQKPIEENTDNATTETNKNEEICVLKDAQSTNTKEVSTTGNKESNLELQPKTESDAVNAEQKLCENIIKPNKLTTDSKIVHKTESAGMNTEQEACENVNKTNELATDSKKGFFEPKICETVKSVPDLLKLTKSEVRSDAEISKVHNLKSEKSLVVSSLQGNLVPEENSKVSLESKVAISTSEIKIGKDKNPKIQVEKLKSEMKDAHGQSKLVDTDVSIKKPIKPIIDKPAENVTPQLTVDSLIKQIKDETMNIVDQKQEDDLGKKDIIIEKQEFDPKILNTVDSPNNTKDIIFSVGNTNNTIKSMPEVATVTANNGKVDEKLSVKAESKEIKRSNLPIPIPPVISSSGAKKLPINITSTIVGNKSEFSVFSNATSIQHSTKPTELSKNESNIKPDTAQNQNDIGLVSNKPNLCKTGSIQSKTLVTENKNHDKGPVNKMEVAKVESTQKKETTKVDTLTVKRDAIQSKPVEVKPMNNNTTPVPFGKWTEANRQEFLNKFKEVKVPSHSSTTQQLKQANDLNRRDILKKIDIQRQTSNAAAAKAQEIASKLPVKPENPAFTNAAKNIEMQGKISLEAEKSEIINRSTVTKTYSKNDCAKDSLINNVATGIKEQRKDINNQALIDRTIEDMLNKPLLNPAKVNVEESKTLVNAQSQPLTADIKPSSQSENSLDAIEMKMNELHGIPFVERPIHELPKVVHSDKKNLTIVETISSQKTKASAKVNIASEMLPLSKQSTKNIELDDDEVIEHEPVTGDSKILAAQKSKQEVYENKNTKERVHTKKEVIITEKDFDKFARRNSITYENKITVNFANKEQCNVVQTVVEKGPVKSEHKSERLPLYGSKPPQTQPLKSNVNKNRYSINVKNDSANMAFTTSTNTKVQHAYNMTMSTKMQKKSPITILEDKPVKVVYMETSPELPIKPLNVQGAKLSPNQPNDTDANLSSCDSLDSDVLDAIDGMRSLDEMKFKTKHQRKQVLTPVEAPDLELIEPQDIDIACSPKKKRRIENKTEKDSKLVVPKKSYLLGRADKDPVIESSHNMIRDTSINHKSTASAIDNLVKAAELIETQSAVALSKETSAVVTNIPVKRGRGRPRKYPLSEGSPDKNTSQNIPSPQKKPRLIETPKPQSYGTDDDSSDDGMTLENWTMGKINENIVCPICNKLFRSENVVFKHVKHCTGPSPSRSDSDKRSPTSSSNEFDFKVIETVDKTSDDTGTNQTPKKRKSRDTVPKYLTEDVIVIEDTPIKEKLEKEKLMNVKHVDKKLNTTKSTVKSKAPKITSNLVCEFCGKTFRQLSYLVSHKLQHKKEVKKVENVSDDKKTVFSCEVCKKEFRKLHHLVQHRIIHNPISAMPLRQSRKSSSEQNDIKNAKNLNVKQNVDQSAGFRCEPCDKSFRKLHHLVEHRETHDCINRQKSVPVTQETTQKIESYQCDVCKKTFKAMELMLEHREQHLETSSEKSDDKSCQSTLSTKDIIHECSLCYMVFPNEHSLNKHTIICQRKKKQSALKQIAEVVIEDSNESVLNSESNADEEEPNIAIANQDISSKTQEETKIDQKDIEIAKDAVKVEEKVKKRISNEPIEKKDKNKVPDKAAESKSLPAETAKPNPAAPTSKASSTRAQNRPPARIPESKKKTPIKDRVPPTVTKRKRSINIPIAQSTKPIESSDDDEIRYMLNPDFVEDTTESKQFMKIRVHKRNSLQFERPNSKDLVKRRTSLQHPPKIPRLKTKAIDHKTTPSVPPIVQKPPKEESVAPIDSDDSDVKYSFPEKPIEKTTEKKAQRKSTAQKKKSLNGIAKRKSLGKTITKLNPTAIKPFKRRVTESEHRCDCGQLFSSAALLSRHTTLSHTPPRIRRRRTPPPERPSTTTPKRKSVDKSKSTTERPADKKTKETRKSIKPESSAKPRRTPFHKCVPLPDKVRKVLEKSAKK